MLFSSKYPSDQAVVSSEVPGRNGGRAEGPVSCGDATKQTAYVSFARQSQSPCESEAFEPFSASLDLRLS